MHTLKKLLIIVTGISALLIISTILFFIFKPKVAGLYVSADPISTVYINGEDVGKTPYKGMRAPGEVVLKIVPEGKLESAYETKVALLPGVETVVRRMFGNSDETSTTEIISFEKVSKDETSLAVVSIPDSVEVTIDNTSKAFTPHKTSVLEEGNHTILLSAKGYLDKTIKVKTHKGFKLTALVTLARATGGVQAGALTPTPAPSPTLYEGSLVQILSTPTGTLRVRKEAKTGSEEIGMVKTGEEYPFLDRDPATGWFKIRFDGQEGWVSSQYARKVEGKALSTSGVNATVTVAPVTKTKQVSVSPTVAASPTLGI